MRNLCIFVTIGLFVIAYSVIKWVMTGEGIWGLSALVAFFIILKLADIKPIHKQKIQIKFHKHTYMSTNRFIKLCKHMANCIDNIFTTDHNLSWYDESDHNRVYLIKNREMCNAMVTIKNSVDKLCRYDNHNYKIDNNAVKELKYYIPKMIKQLEYYKHILHETGFRGLTRSQKNTIDHIEETTITFSKLFERCIKDVENIIAAKYDIDTKCINEMMSDYLEDTSHDKLIK